MTPSVLRIAGVSNAVEENSRVLEKPSKQMFSHTSLL